MASRVRQSTVQPTQRRTGNEPPPYEVPTFSLNPAGQRALAQLNHTHSLRKLDESLSEAQSALSNAAAEINDRLTAKERAARKRKDAEDGDNEDADQSLDELRDKVERMTQRMDESMRKMIDGQHSVQFMKGSVASAAEHARANASTQASTQNVRSQRRRRRETSNGDDEDQDSEDEYQDFVPTDPTTGAAKQTALLESFRSKLEDERTRYQSHSLTARYANNNDYRDFRRVIHDAKHPDGDVRLAHHAEWFNEGDAPAPGVTTRGRANAEEMDDDDIAISRTNVSTKCPLTLQEFKSPLTSNKCPHSFESDAILSMLSTSTARENNKPGGERQVQCPVSGCSQRLTRNDLHTDAVLIRQIQRIQRARELEAEDAEDEEPDENGISIQRRPTVIDEDGGDGADVDDIVEGRVIPQTQVKNEAKSTWAMGRPPSTAPRSSTAVVDLDDGNSDATDEDAMEE